MRITSVVALAATVLVSGCFRTSKKVQWEIPDGFRGVVVVTEHAGAPAPAKKGGTYTVVVPPGGNVRIAALSFFESWSEERAKRVPSGVELPVRVPQDRGETGPALWHLWSSTASSGAASVSFNLLFVGTFDELKDDADVKAARDNPLSFAASR